MILVDTSVWVSHLQDKNDVLAQRLDQTGVLMHPFVLGELALVGLARRPAVFGLLRNLPTATSATDAEMLGFIEQHALHDTGIGYVDAHLLAATRLTPGSRLWTFDKRLQAAADRLGVNFVASR